MTERTDEELMVDYQQGDDPALEILFSRHKLGMFNFAHRILQNRADAEDVLSEVFLKLLDRKIHYEPRAKFKTWLYTIARNACLTKFRKSKKLLPLMIFSRNKEDAEQSWDVPDEKAGPADQAGKREIAVHVKNAIQKLPMNQKEAIVLREYHDMSYQEISQVLDQTLDNVKVLIFRAREALRKDLAAVLEEGLS